jgi:uncharacterized protein YnzC (UPF0291/DUF896 family)
MRIRKQSPITADVYTEELRERVQTVWEESEQLAELERLLEEIKRETKNLEPFFFTQEDQAQQDALRREFDERVQGMVAATISNMDKYRIFAWKELIYDGENEDDETKSTQ